MKRTIIYLLISLTVFTTKIIGQPVLDNINFWDKWSVTASSGGALEWGDVETNWYGNFRAKPAFALVLTKELNSTFELRTEAILASLIGTQPNYNRDFTANVFEYNIAGTIDFTRLSFGINPCRKFSVHGILGIGFLNFSSILKTINSDSILYATGYDNKGNKTGYKTEPVLNTGLNIKYKISSQVYIIFENTWSITGTDYLDGVKRGFAYDIYSYTSLGVSYRFNFRKHGKAFSDCGGGGTVTN